ncbi:U-box domain-containing protein 35-like [Impatiens glandulifera]|uniref:U-box domain-containing protein 35-like n=1 Tax=Impatiens glandulifera TaxID=253017 RepID=UPI001FB16FE9|nr:U-box domain-containing protein 35-like [Impatiens glandulifera]
MWLPNANSSATAAASNAGTNVSGNSLVAVAIDKDKGSQQALKWTIDNLLLKGQTVILIHVLNTRSNAHSSPAGMAFNGDAQAHRKQLADKQTKELFLTFHCFCTRKDVKCLDVVLEDTDIAKGLLEYISYSAIDNLVLGTPSRRGFIRKFKMTDVSSQVSKGAPDFCTIYAISTKGKISSVRNASRPAPFNSPLHSQIEKQTAQDLNVSARCSYEHSRSRHTFSMKDRTPRKQWSSQSEGEFIRSPFGQTGRGYNNNTGRSNLGDFSDSSETDVSFVSSSRPSTSDRSSISNLSVYDIDYSSSRPSTSSEYSFGSIRQGGVLLKYPVDGSGYLVPEFSSASIESARSSTSSTTSYVALDEVEGEMRRLKLELKQTMDLYSSACKEALTAKEKAMELHHWRLKEERRLEEARMSEEAALARAEKEKAKCRAAMESAEAARRIAELESKKRLSAERKALVDRDNKFIGQDIRYRRYTIEDIEEATELFTESRKIGEGGYGPVYHCYLDHTPVAVKVLRSDAAQGRQQFQQEVEVLSCMRHPNMVLLLGACPEYGCLVYEYMANGSLDDRIFRKGNSLPLSWQLRFRIAMEIATGLLFLHQTKPEPWVHRDLKPANILLDHNCVSKISDVGLARLVPPSVADDVTQYLVTSAAGTFCFIDPEYQQTGMLGIKSDIYSFGVLLLQLITAKPAMGLSHHVRRSIDKGTFATEMLDPILNDWPVEEALILANLALQCAELRRKDRPDLGKVVLPELQRLRAFADHNQQPHHLTMLYGSTSLTSAEPSPNHSFASSTFSHSAQDVMSDSDLNMHSRNSSPASHSSCASLPDDIPDLTE